MPNKLVLLLLLLPTIACAQSPTNIGSAVFPPDHITVQTGTPTIAVGQTAAFTATLVLADGSSNIDETPNCIWSSSNPAVASFADSGLPVATGNLIGTVTVTCTPQSNPLAIVVNTATLTVSAAPIILTPPSPAFAMPAGTNGSPYVGYQLTAAAGVPPYTWSISVGSLPNGLSLSSTGCGSSVNCQIGGTPTVNNTFNFTVKVTDSTPGTPLTATQTASITVSAGTCASGLSYNPPTTYCSTTSTAVDTWPTFAPAVYTGLTGTNNFATETSTTGLGNGAWSVVRVSDSLSATQGSSTMSEPLSHGFSCQPVCSAGNYFFFVRTNNGGAAWYQFNAANFPGASPITWMGNVIGMSDGQQMSQDDKQWSYNLPNILYTSGTTASSSSYVPATIGYATVNLAAAAPWTSSTFTHTTLLTPQGDVTNPCNGLTIGPEWNKYLYVSPGDNRITSGDSGGAGTNIVTTFFRYQVDQGRIVVVYDGTAPSGSRCTWLDAATAMISIHGAAAVPINGFGPVPAPTSGPSATLNTTGGSLTCPSSPSNNISLVQTYTIANVGETTPSPITSLQGGSGNTCSFTVTPPSSSPSLVGFTGVHPTGYNVYMCQGLKSSTCAAPPTNYQLVSQSPNSFTLTATCNVTTGTSQYSYYQIAVWGSGMSAPTPVAQTGTNCANRLGASSPGTQVSVTSSKQAGATSIVVCRDFLTVCFQGLGGVFTDKGQSPTLFVTQTNAITTTMTYVGTSGTTGSSCPTCTPPTVNTAGINMHGNGITGPGYVSLAVPDYEKPNAKVLVNVQNGNAITLDLGNAGAQVSPCDGHAPSTIDWLFCLGTSEALLHFTLSDNATNVQASQFNMFSTVALGNPNEDRHTMYPDMRTDNFVLGVDTYPLPLSYCSPGGTCASTSFPWDGEYLGFPSNNANAPFRFARNWTSGQNFNSSARGNISQDGKYAIFNSDGLRNGTGSTSCASTGACGFGGFSGNTTTTGCTPGASGNCRSEVMLIKLN